MKSALVYIRNCAEKLALVCAMALATLSFTGLAHAQIPVTVTSDIPATMNQMEIMGQWAEQFKKWKDQYDQMEKQIGQLRDTYNSITGMRNLGSILNDPQFDSYLPQDWQQVYQQAQKGGYSGISGSAKAIFDAAKIYDRCKASIGDAQVACQAESTKAAQDLAFGKAAYEKAEGRLNQIKSLMQQINQTKDPKAIAELQGRIDSEQAAIQNEATKLQMFQVIAQANDRMQLEQRNQLAAKSLDTRANFTARDIQWRQK